MSEIIENLLKPRRTFSFLSFLPILKIKRPELAAEQKPVAVTKHNLNMSDDGFSSHFIP